MLLALPLLVGLQYWPKERVVWDSPKSQITFSIGGDVVSGFRLRKRDKASGAMLSRDFSGSELGFERLVGDPDKGPFAIVRTGIGGWDHYGNSHILSVRLEPILQCREVWDVGTWGALISDVADNYPSNLRFVSLGKKPRTVWTRPYQGIPIRLSPTRLQIGTKRIIVDARTGKTLKKG